MPTGKTLQVECQCGQVLLTYHKQGKGRLIKCFLSEIRTDHVGLVDLSLGTRPVCPGCYKTLGEIRLVSGRPALKLNQGTIKKLRL